MSSFNEPLPGLIPICAGCKKILNGSGVWSQAEDVPDHSEGQFTHALCPDCMLKYGWVDDKNSSAVIQPRRSFHLVPSPDDSPDLP